MLQSKESNFVSLPYYDATLNSNVLVNLVH